MAHGIFSCAWRLRIRGVGRHAGCLNSVRLLTRLLLVRLHSALTNRGIGVRPAAGTRGLRDYEDRVEGRGGHWRSGACHDLTTETFAADLGSIKDGYAAAPAYVASAAGPCYFRGDVGYSASQDPSVTWPVNNGVWG